MQTVDPTMFCLISLLIIALIAVSFREVDWTAEARREREKRANNASNGLAGTRHKNRTGTKPANR